jgi:hypothetical protein
MLAPILLLSNTYTMIEENVGASDHDWAGYTSLFFSAAILVFIGVIIGSWTTSITTEKVVVDPVLLPGEWCIVQQ